MKNEFNLLKIARIRLQVTSILLSINNEEKLEEIVNSLNDKDVMKLLMDNANFLRKKDYAETFISRYFDKEDCYQILTKTNFLRNDNKNQIVTAFDKLSIENKKNLFGNSNFINSISKDTLNDLLSLPLHYKYYEKELTNPLLLNKLSSNNIFSILEKVYYGNNYIDKSMLNNIEVLKRVSAKELATLFYEPQKIFNFFEIGVPFNKAIMILKYVYLTNKEKAEILNKYYKTDYSSFKEAYDKLISNVKSQVINNNSEKGLSLITVDLNDILLDSTDELLKKLFKNEIKDPVIKEIVIRNAITQFAKQLNVYTDVSFQNIPGLCGSYYHPNKTLSINADYLTSANNIDLFVTIFHELIHAKQHREMEEKSYDYKILQFLKDNILANNLRNYNSANYFVNSYEVDARCQSYVLTYRLLKRITPIDAELYLRENLQEYCNDLLKERDLIRVVEKRTTTFLEEVFDQIDRKSLKAIIRKYPILSLEYDETTGEKKSITSLFIEYISLKLQAKNLDKNSNDYKKYIFYVNYFNNYVKIYQNTTNKETLLKYLKDFKMLKKCVYYGVLEYKEEIDNLINRENSMFKGVIFVETEILNCETSL